jgi:hypothetical protein
MKFLWNLSRMQSAKRSRSIVVGIGVAGAIASRGEAV